MRGHGRPVLAQLPICGPWCRLAAPAVGLVVDGLRTPYSCAPSPKGFQGFVSAFGGEATCLTGVPLVLALAYKNLNTAVSGTAIWCAVGSDWLVGALTFNPDAGVADTTGRQVVASAGGTVY